MAASPHNYIFIGLEREKIHDSAFLASKAFEGAQLKYTWRELEPQEGSYDFAIIQHDLDFLTKHRKRLFIQLQDATFALQYKCVPRYLLNDPQFHGGINKQYSGDSEQGWVARRWDKSVRNRFQMLLISLGKHFDGRIEGINLPETAADIPTEGPNCPPGFTATGYRDGLIENMTVLKRAFPHSVAMQYANFMPGEWLPGNDHGYLRSIYQKAAELKVGVGGPDLLPFKPGQMSHAYPLIIEVSGKVPTGIAVQDGNYAAINPKTGKPSSVGDLVEFASKYLHVNYIFWCTEQPYYSKNLVPFFKK